MLKVVKHLFLGSDPLKAGNLLPKSSSIKSLSPILDPKGFLRVGGRLNYSDISYDACHPLIVPNGRFSYLLMEFHHYFYKHCGAGIMLSNLRDQYWIVKARRTAKSVIKSCKRCQRYDSRNLTQPAPPLPKFRIQRAPPFSISGLDFAGPVYAKDYPGRKYYILLFTCAVTRALHLELTGSLSFKDCMMAIRRFCSRRGQPSLFYSDNAKTFINCQQYITRVFGNNAPKWKFIPPCSPWWGGWWEQFVRAVKSSLKKTLHYSQVEKIELETIITEIESIINSRPLTYVSDVPSDQGPLTPAHFLLGKPVSIGEVGDDTFTFSSRELLFCHSIKQNLINPLWLEFSFTLEYFFKCRFWVANISNVGKNIKKVEVCLTVQILGFCRKMLSLPNSSRI